MPPNNKCTSKTGFHIYRSYKKEKRLHTHFRCKHPDCSHTLERKLVVGRRAECPYCGETYVITFKQLNLALPHCNNCTQGRKEQKKTVEIPQEMEEMLRGM